MGTKMIDIANIIQVITLSGVGIVVFAITFWLMVKISPFSVRKEIEEDQNTSLAILYGSVFIALAILISAGIS
jgi:putative membrane protein